MEPTAAVRRRADLEFRILGSLEFRVGAAAIEVGGHRQRAVLARSSSMPVMS